MYINHINKYDDAQAIQDALNAGTLANPYVAMTSAGTIDYNSLEPTPEPSCYIGEWSDDGQGAYTFQITDTDPSKWERDVKIGELLGVYSDGNHEDLDVMLLYNQPADAWHMDLFSEIASDTPANDFEDGVSDTWYEEGVATDPNESSAYLEVSWDGADTFVFRRVEAGSGPAIQMTTINIDCPDSDGK